MLVWLSVPGGMAVTLAGRAFHPNRRDLFPPALRTRIADGNSVGRCRWRRCQDGLTRKRAMKPNVSNTAEAADMRELQPEDIDLISGAAIHISVFGIAIDITQHGACVTVGKKQGCVWFD
jgi:hypothetical protein